MNEPVIEVKNLVKRFRPAGGKGMRAAVDNISFSVYRGEILGLLGESGCGKTTLARMLMHLTAPSEGKILFDGREVQDLPERQFRKLRGKIQMVYQNPFDSLDPSKKIKSLLEEPMRIWYPKMSAQERAERIQTTLEECGLPADSLSKKPSGFSGGQLQRISIARALLAQPEILIADEVVSALDVTIQSQILKLLVRMRKEHNLTILFITHDLSVARSISDRIMVMQEGKIRGIGIPDEVLENTEDAYIRALDNAVFTFAGEAF